MRKQVEVEEGQYVNCFISEHVILLVTTFKSILYDIDLNEDKTIDNKFSVSSVIPSYQNPQELLYVYKITRTASVDL